MGWEDFQLFRKMTKKRVRAEKKEKQLSSHGSKRLLNALLRTLTSQKHFSEEDLGSVLDVTIEKVLETVHAQAITLYLIEDDAIHFRYNYLSPTLWGEDAELAGKYASQREKMLEMTLPLGTGIVGKVISEGKPYISIDAQNDANFLGEVDKDTGFQTHSMITVPIETSDEVIGAIQVLNKDGAGGVPFFTREDVQLLDEVAGYSAKVIRKAKDPSFHLDDDEIAFYISKLTNFPYMKIDDDFELNMKLVELVTTDLIEELEIIPHEKAGESTVSVLMANPMLYQKKETFQYKTGLKISKVFVVSSAAVKNILDRFKKLDTGIGEVAGLIRDEFQMGKDAESIDVDEGANEESAPIIQLANRIIEDAYVQDASDIHVEPREYDTIVRYRVDGILMEKLTLPKSSHSALITRLKIMSELDISEKRLPQDGRIIFKKFTRKNLDLDLRVSSAPINFGEKMCMRILDKSKSALPLDALGFSEHNLKIYRDIIREPYGMILHTGPTGSGKSMTLYSALGEIATPKINIQTAEDPIEYTLAGINQMQMKPKIGLNFSRALRCFLRQDPDIILVGEIRDTETANIAIEAALTGHLLFSTLHTNDAPTTITRFLEMGIEPFMVSSSLQCACSQRLLRRLCRCKTRIEPDEHQKRLAQLPDDFTDPIYKAKGCNRCGGSGYKGRTGTHELLIMDDEIRDMINRRATALEIKKVAVANGMETLHDDSMLKVRQGICSIEEALRVVKVDESSPAFVEEQRLAKERKEG
jgi:type IV pilus assembly protein PilB